MKSQAQRRYLWAKHPGVAQEFEDKTPAGKKLPEKVASLTDLYIQKQANSIVDVAKSFAGQARNAGSLKNLGSMAKGHWGMLSGGQKAGLTAGAAALPAFAAGRMSKD